MYVQMLLVHSIPSSSLGFVVFLQPVDTCFKGRWDCCNIKLGKSNKGVPDLSMECSSMISVAAFDPGDPG